MVPGPAGYKNWAEKGFGGVSPHTAEDDTARSLEIETIIIIRTVSNHLVWKILFPMKPLPTVCQDPNKLAFFFFLNKLSALFVTDWLGE